MSAIFRLDRPPGILFDAHGAVFDAAARAWRRGTGASPSRAAEQLDAIGAVTWLQRESGFAVRVPIGVIGPRQANERQHRVAREIGEHLARCGLAVICGGRQGIMQAACEGVARGGGISIGLLPESDAANANPFVTVAIATGIGEARNALIARAALCLVAIGDSFGTLSEVALARHFGKVVVGLEGAARVAGVEHVADAGAVIMRVADCVLAVGQAAD